MNELVEITKKRVQRQLENLSCEILGITQEDGLIIGWYNTPDGSTHVVTSEIPFYDTYNNLSNLNREVV